MSRLFQDCFSCDDAESEALALAAHPWPDERVSNAAIDAIAAELLPSRNLNHHDVREVAIDRLLRIAEALEHESERALSARYLDAAGQLQNGGNESSKQIVAARSTAWQGGTDLLLSPLGYGVPVARQDAPGGSKGPTSAELAESLAHLAGLAAASGSADVGLICGDKPTGVSIHDLARRLQVSLPLDDFDRHLNELNSRDRDILVSRSFVLGPPDTLEDVANRWKVTRERIRQLEGPLKAAVVAQFSTAFKRLGQPVLADYTRLLIPTEELHSAARRGVSGSQWCDTAAAVVLQSNGPWRKANGWAVHPSIDERVRELKASLEADVDRHGLLTDEVVRNTFDSLFRDETDQLKYAQNVLGLGRTCGQWTIRDTYKCRIAAALKFLGQPATKDEVAALTGMATSNVGSIFGTLEGVVRADKERWGFEEWIDDAYDGIFGEIVQRIDAFGGSVPVNLILREIPSRFGVSEGSVKAYLSSDAFTIEDDFVRRAEEDEYAANPPASVSGAVQVDGVWGQRLPLFERHFIGYSLGVSFDIAYANGLRPDDDLLVPVAGTDVEVSVIWRRHSLNRLVDVGRASDVLRDSGFRDGDDVIVIPGRESVSFLSVADVEIQLATTVVGDSADTTPESDPDARAGGDELHDPLLDLLGG